MPRSVILFLTSDPVHVGAWAIERECAAIDRALAMTPGRDAVELRPKWAVTIDGLMRHLLDLAPAVLHFCGRGSLDGVALSDDAGRRLPLAPAALSRIVATSPGVQLAVLSGCYSDRQAEALRDTAGCVVGTTGEATDDAAREFAVGLYRALGYRRPVGNAYRQAVAALDGKGLLALAEPRCLVRPDIAAGALRLGAPARPGIAAPGRDEP